MTNVSAVEKMAELMQQMEENSPRVAALQYCLTHVAEKVEEAEKRNAELEARCAALAAENALASLEAEPVAYIGERMLADLIDGARSCGRIWPEVTDKMSGEDRIPLFLAPPAPASVPGVMDVLGGVCCEVSYADGWNACRAAMLQGAELVTTANKLPAEAAYGYFAFNDHHGEEFFKNREDAIAFCKEAIEEYRQENADEGCDPDEVRRTCWGIIMQEGTDIEVDNEGHIDYALTPELDGNSPAIPDGWVACSERMPSPSTGVIVAAPWQSAPGGYAMKWATNCPGHPDADIDGWIIPGASWSPTHWMPLPAAPQQRG